MRVIRFLFLLSAFLLVACGADGGNNDTAVSLPEGPTLLMFYTEAWPPWAAMEPIVNGLEAEFSGQIEVLRLDANVQENVELQRQYGLQGHPAFVVLDEEGTAVQIFFGSQTEEVLRGAIRAVVGPWRGRPDRFT